MLVASLVTCLALVSCDRHTSTTDGTSRDAPGDDATRGAPAPAAFLLDGRDPVDGVPGELADAVRAQVRRIASAPDRADGYRELGMLYDSNSLPGRAAAAYAEAVARDVRDARALYHLGRMRLQLGDVEGARDAWTACAGLAPEVPTVHARLGDLFLDTGEDDLARAAYEAARVADPEHPAGVEGLARAALARGEPGEAAALLEAWLARHPERGHARFLLGTAYRALGRIDDARTQLELGAGASPALPDPWLDETLLHVAGYRGVMDRAVQAGRAGQASAVVDDLLALRRAHPDDVPALEKLVAALLQLGRKDEALTALDDFDRHVPDHPRALYLRALVLEARGSRADARTAVTRSLAVQDDWVPAHELAARLAWGAGDLRGAAGELEAALHHGGPRVDTLLKLARARTLLGDATAATDALRRATDAAPTHVEAWMQRCADAVGRRSWSTARDALDRLVALAPGDPRTEQLRQAIASSATGGASDG